MEKKIPTSALQYVKGVGPKRAELYAKLGILDAEGLLRHYPRDYVDATSPLSIAEAEYGVRSAVRGKVYQKLPTRILPGGRRLAKALISDGMHSMAIVFFNLPYACDQLKIGEEYVFWGKVAGSLATKEMVNPMVLSLKEAENMIPVYRLTRGLTSRQIAKNVASVLASSGFRKEETLPASLLKKYDYPSLEEALRIIHSPKDQTTLSKARKRLIFEELLVLQMALSSVRRKGSVNRFPITADLNPFVSSLPFSLTCAQTRALHDCMNDLSGPSPMSRLIQGDVGSGKTMVAAGVAFSAAKCGIQSALMAPTEILAVQHLHTMEKVLSPLGVRVALLKGGMKKKERDGILSSLAAGEIDLLVGTHALFREDVVFSKLGLVITDEQHRFGVEQRSLLSKKGQEPHVLVMSATPIPRSLALVIYGDLDVSVIDELPQGRQPVKTYLVDSGKRQRMYGFLNKLMDEGQQGFIVCPAVEENPEAEEENEPENVTDYAKKVGRTYFAHRRCAVLHGKMKGAEKEKIMAAFSSGEIDLLFATTVVEVGVDVPNATFMVIENAERFGLSQMHQLRGRVGRGRLESHCILVSDDPNEMTRHRLKTLCSTNDGFVLASEDLKMRGPGDFFGSRQHGLPQMQIADLMTDMQILERAKEEASLLLADSAAQTEGLKDEVDRLVRRLDSGAIS